MTPQADPCAVSSVPKEAMNSFFCHLIVILVSIFFLYIAARQSHYRFMEAVEEFNQLK